MFPRVFAFRSRSALTHSVIPRCHACAWLCLVVLSSPAALGADPARQMPSRCGALPIPGRAILPEDAAAEQAFCAVDVNSESVAVCPKTWSTSPGAPVYSLSGTEWEVNAAGFEAEFCGAGGHARDRAHSELAIFKNSLNGRKTSGTFAPAALLYYHFSRLLETQVQVPVAVPVEFPVSAYRARVVKPGLAYSDSGRLGMMHEGWLEMDRALSDPAAYSHRQELFTADGQWLWGVFLLEEGRRYGPEVNGTRASGWGDGQNRDFQQTAPFLALRADLPLAQAIAAGIDRARQDEGMAGALSAETSPQQVARWMRDITEIVILDYMLRQQDRIGNVDYVWRWHWLEDGELRLAEDQPADENALRLRLSVLNDNDAGVRASYANYAARTDMLADWHHMDADLYRRLQALATDFQGSGPVAQAVRRNYRISSREADGIIQRGIELAARLRQRCEAGALRFDLSPQGMLSPDDAQEEAAACAGPEEEVAPAR
jgi:hypothetical protein